MSYATAIHSFVSSLNYQDQRQLLLDLAVKFKGLSIPILQCCGDALRGDFEFCNDIVEIDRRNYFYTDYTIKLDREFSRNACIIDPLNFIYCPGEFKDDYDFALEQVGLHPPNFVHCSSNLRANRKFAKFGVEKDVNNCEFINHAEMYGYKKFYLDLIKRYPECIKHCRLLCDEDFVIKAVRRNPKCYPHLPRINREDDSLGKFIYYFTVPI
ncbi:hypothetical protein RCL1_007294 [Eukaryota sp. TZLM3-RCL]